jgi:hypothetical protein
MFFNLMIKLRGFVSLLSALLLAFLGSSCNFNNATGGALPPTKQESYGYTPESPSRMVSFDDVSVSKTVTINNLEGKDIYVLKINTSQDTLAAEQLGAVSFVESFGFSGDLLSGDEIPLQPFAGNDYAQLQVIRRDNPAITTFNANPPPFTRKADSLPSFSAFGAPLASSYTIDITKKNFWVEDEASLPYTWYEKPATLRASGSHCNIWVADENYDNSSSVNNDNHITSAQANALAVQFDFIYGLETAVFGYEYGGGQGGDGGVDKDLKIQILVYDIYKDYSSSQTGGTIGFFWSKDEFSDAQLPTEYKSNNAEIFYLDAHFIDAYPSTAYSTLAHEFQHMINFNRKSVLHEKNAAAWYNEMLSMLAEDMIDPMIGIPSTDSGHPVSARIPLFLDGYRYSGPTEWHSGDDVFYSYSSAYAFGAFLARNYGGANLVSDISKNSFVDEESISDALAKQGNIAGSSFTKALAEYGKAMVLNRTESPSFNITATNSVGSNVYVFTGFDIFSMLRRNIDGYPTGTGPATVLPTDTGGIRPSSFGGLIQQNAWKNRSGSLRLVLNKPKNAAIETYIVIK